ncbi:MAG: signal recognition particle-docking protein FtsY [Bacillota bacterium]
MAQNYFSRLLEGLSRTREAISGVFTGRQALDPSFLLDLEEALILSDVGYETTEALVERLRKRAKQGINLKELVREEIAGLLSQRPWKIELPADALAVILVVGVNGTGKTTSAGKMAHLFRTEGRKPLLAAADTFRAAAGEQLEIWAKRAGVDCVRHREGADPAAVVFDAISAARHRGADLVIADTAGRLHTKTNLMEELRKVRRVVEREVPGAPHETLLVLDATTGQNGLAQAEVFKQMLNITGIVLTKMDGTAKGGVVLAIAHKMGLPVKLVGLGEKLEDLLYFEPYAFSQSLIQ